MALVKRVCSNFTSCQYQIAVAQIVKARKDTLISTYSNSWFLNHPEYRDATL